MASQKNIKIKTGTLKRVFKEVNSYEKELQMELARTEKMKAEGADSHDLKQQLTYLTKKRVMTLIQKHSLKDGLYILVHGYFSSKGRMSKPSFPLQESVLGETQMMIPDAKKRLQNAFQDLQSAVEEGEADASLQESEEYKSAKEALAEVEPAL